MRILKTQLLATSSPARAFSNPKPKPRSLPRQVNTHFPSVLRPAFRLEKSNRKVQLGAAQAETEATVEMTLNSAAPEEPRTALALINESTKFGVSAVAFGTLFYFHNLAACWALTGSILNALAGKILKRLLNMPRPGRAPQADPGMPSSHALSLGYLATTASACLLVSEPLGWAGRGALFAASLQLLGLSLAALRVAMGFHTFAQVAVGYALGLVNAVLWHRLGTAAVLPFLAGSEVLAAALVGVTAVAVALFALQAKRWIREAGARLGRGGQAGAKGAEHRE